MEKEKIKQPIEPSVTYVTPECAIHCAAVSTTVTKESRKEQLDEHK
jgi:hypothetical protein